MRYLNPAPVSPTPSVPEVARIGLLVTRTSKFLLTPNFSSPLMSCCEAAASTPHSVSSTPGWTGWAGVETVGRLGTAVNSSWARTEQQDESRTTDMRRRIAYWFTGWTVL